MNIASSAESQKRARLSEGANPRATATIRAIVQSREPEIDQDGCFSEFSTEASLNACIQLSIEEGRHAALILFSVHEVEVRHVALLPWQQKAILRKVASRLIDVSSSAEAIVWLAEDEFAVLAITASDFDSAVWANMLRARLEAAYQVAGESAFVGICAGVVPNCSGYDDPQTAIRDADGALRRATERGKGAIEISRSLPTSARALQGPHLQRQLRRAVDRGELVYHYQPIVDVTSRKPIGCEALLRWRHPRRGLLLPQEFIHDLEDGNLLTDLAWSLLSKALSRLALWRLCSSLGNDFTLSINFTGKQLAQAGVHDRLLHVLARHRLPPSALCIEVAENARICGQPQIVESLKRFSELGIRVLLDDFGTGYASLRHLSELPISTLKIDRSFVREILSNRSHARIVSSVIEMSNGLGLNIVAEGVETEEQLSLLVSLGCSYAQGSLFGEALAPDLFGQKAVQSELS